MKPSLRRKEAHAGGYYHRILTCSCRTVCKLSKPNTKKKTEATCKANSAVSHEIRDGKQPVTTRCCTMWDLHTDAAIASCTVPWLCDKVHVDTVTPASAYKIPSGNTVFTHPWYQWSRACGILPSADTACDHRGPVLRLDSVALLMPLVKETSYIG